MRDSQRNRAQSAQVSFRGEQRTFASLEEIQQYIDSKIHGAWFRKRWPKIANLGMVAQPITLTKHVKHQWSFERIIARRNKFKNAFFPMIYFPVQIMRSPEDNAELGRRNVDWNELLVWHLVAHHCSEELHGRGWAVIFLNLVTKFMGKEAGKELRGLFRKHRVHFTRRKVLTQEQRDAARERAERSGFLTKRSHENSQTDK